MPTDTDDSSAVESRDAFLSVARTALFLMDLVAVQQFLPDRALVTPDVESVVIDWLDEYEAELQSLAQHLPAILESTVALEAWRRSVEAMLDNFVARLPVRPDRVVRPTRLSHAG